MYLSLLFKDKECKIIVKFNISNSSRTKLEIQKLQVSLAVKKAIEIKSIYNHLGVLITYLKGLLKFGDLIKDIRHLL